MNPLQQLHQSIWSYAHRPRDRQRSRVYAWERSCVRLARRRPAQPAPNLADLQALQLWLDPIWRSERARYGLPGAPSPRVVRPHRGQRRALAYPQTHVMSFPVWARTPWNVLHEVTHLLVPNAEAHGPRFVGVLIGLLTRHAEQDPDELLASAEAHGVKVDQRSIGARPRPARVGATPAEQLLQHLPGTDIELALQMDLHWRQVRGIALRLTRQGLARWRGQQLVRLRSTQGATR